MSLIDETLRMLSETRRLPSIGDDPTARNAAIAYTAIENAVLGAKSGEVDWAYCEHELTTARLRFPSLDHGNLRVAVRVLFLGGPRV